MRLNKLTQIGIIKETNIFWNMKKYLQQQSIIMMILWNISRLIGIYIQELLGGNYYGIIMGSVGANKNVANTFTVLPDTNIKSLKPTKRSEEVFTREYTLLRKLARDSSLHFNDNEEVFSKRMIQGMQARLNSEWHGLEIDAKLGVGTEEERRVKRYALTMLQRMMNNYYHAMYE